MALPDDPCLPSLRLSKLAQMQLYQLEAVFAASATVTYSRSSLLLLSKLLMPLPLPPILMPSLLQMPLLQMLLLHQEQENGATTALAAN